MNVFHKIRILYDLALLWLKKNDSTTSPRQQHPTPLGYAITKSLIVGRNEGRLSLQQLKDSGITAIVNVRQASNFTEAYIKGFRYLHIPTSSESPPTLSKLIRCASFVDEEIRKRDGKVYIHCRHGLRRGPSIAIAYLLKCGMTFDDAISLLKNIPINLQLRPVYLLRLKELERHFLDRRN
jgi:protein-tyrosine phosphatase